MLTVVIPTRNRPVFLGRLLGYYARLRFSYPILVGDSSDASSFEENRRAVERFRAGLSVSFLRYPSDEGKSPGQGTIECMVELLARVETPLVVFQADDDFLVPEALEEAAEFLKIHPDYSMVHGEGRLFKIGENGTRRIDWVERYPQAESAWDCASRRLLENLSRHTGTEFSLKRTSQARSNWRAARTLELDNYFGELLVAGLGAVQGKAKKLSRFYLMRQAHSKMTSGNSPDLFDWVTGLKWSAQYQRFQKALAEALSQADRIGLEQARAVVAKGSWAYLANQLASHWGGHYLPARPDWKEALRGSRLLRRIWDPVEIQMRPFKADFDPIREAVVG